MTRRGYVLAPGEGEHLIRNAGSIFIKVDPRRGSHGFALGTQQLPVAAGIRVHQHNEADEVLFVLEVADSASWTKSVSPSKKGPPCSCRRARGTGSRIPMSR